jgi:hypothetical protein
LSVEEEEGEREKCMLRETRNDASTLQSEQWCQSCQKTKLLSAFSPRTAMHREPKKICLECELLKHNERHYRILLQREIGQEQQQERENQRQKIWERRVLLRQNQEEHDRKLEQWYQHQPERCCATCQQILPASTFGGRSSGNSFILYTRCKTCHTAMIEQRYLPCCLCQKKTARRNFLSHFKGYALCGDGASIALCCHACEKTFLALSEMQQAACIHSCCQRAFPDHQVIYAEIDPETREIRYIGRTSQPTRRHTQHLSDRSARESQWGPERIPWYTRRNWVHALVEKNLTPSMQILHPIEVAPLVLEWEQRFIFHGIQQGWNLLNHETMQKDLVTRIKTACIDFFAVPFELLVQQHFFSPHGLLAFLHEWYRPEHIREPDAL